jgi:hypothetical protein
MPNEVACESGGEASQGAVESSEHVWEAALTEEFVAAIRQSTADTRRMFVS